MKTKRTELVFILDKSGSMSGLEEDTIGGFNSMLEKQQKEPGEATVTTVLFDNRYQILHDRLDLSEVCSITHEDYFVEGSTALLDAVGKTINIIGNAQKNANEHERADKVLFVIITDGMENASREYSYEVVSKMIERQKSKYEWEFIFLGANIDVEATAARFSIDARRSVRYRPDAEGTRLNYEAVSECASEYRRSKKICDRWKKKIDDDYNERT